MRGETGAIETVGRREHGPIIRSALRLIAATWRACGGRTQGFCIRSEKVGHEVSGSASKSSDPGYLRVPLLGLAVASSAVALTCLATLAVVAAVKDADTLSTVALALAVIAFVAQLIVFVVQGSAANAQMLQSQELHAQLLGLLGEVGERTKGTEAAISTMSERLLEAALGKALAERRTPSEELDVREVARETFAAAGQADDASDSVSYLPRRPSADDARLLAELDRPVTLDEAEALVDTLRSLSPYYRTRLRSFVDDERTFRSPDALFEPGLAVYGGDQDELVQHGLIAVDPDSGRSPGRPLYVLTDSGRNLARLVSGAALPEEIAPEVARLMAEQED
jgi:heme/copper-type cytochrome/quinol oxidase subunit 4